jgi:hypothetical protein
VWLPPNDTACVDAFTVRARDVTSGAPLPKRDVNTSLSAVYAGLTPGATYRFFVAAAGAAAGSGRAAIARAVTPPGLLEAKPGPPERFKAVAADAASVRLSWDIPAGNPR